MNHKYTWLLLMCITGATQAQRVNRATLPAFAHPTRADRSALTVRPGSAMETRAAGDVIFSEDFANGTAGNNGVGAWTLTGPDAQIWKWTDSGPDGGFSSNAEALESTSAGNGWMIFDTDRSNSDTTVNPPDPLPTDQFVSRDGYLESPQLDLTATPYVHLEFEMRARWCCFVFPVFFVDVSTDGGGSWPMRLDVADPDQSANDDPGTYSVRVNLQNAIADGLGSVKFRFAWEGSASGGTGMSHYFAQVDDVKLVESPYNDLDAKNPSFNQYAPGTVTQFAEFNIFPVSQLAALNMGSPVGNEGQYTAINAVMHADVTRGGSPVFSGDATQPTLAPGVLDSSFVINYTPDVAGDYEMTLTLASDSADANPDNNGTVKSWEVDDYIYAQDEGGRDGLIRDETDVEGEYHSCNFFWIENDASVYAMQVALASGNTNTHVGAAFECTVLDGDFAELGTTAIATVASTSQLSGNGQAKWFTVMFNEPLELTGGQEVCACLHFLGGSELVATASSGTSILGESLFMRANEDNSRFIELASPMVRLNFNPSVGIEEADRQNGIGMGQNLPNPANGVTAIPYDLKEAANLSFEVHDMSGKLVATQAVGKRAAGAHRLQFDTSALNEGVYFYSLIANGTRLTKRMTVIR
jgi:hypothetical protein